MSVRERYIDRYVVERYWPSGRGYALRFPAYGRRQYVTLGLEPEWTPARAIEERDNILADVRRRLWVPPDRNRRRSAAEPAVQPDGRPAPPTFAEFFAKYLARRRGAVAEETYNYEEWAIRLHLRPFFANHRVDAITAVIVDDYVQAEVEEAVRRRDAIERGQPLTITVNGRSQRLEPLANVSINKTLDVLQAVLNLASDYKYVTENVAEGKRRRLPEPPRESVSVDTVDGIVAMLDAAAILDSKPRYRTIGRLAMIVVLIFTGLRAHELCALNWNDIDLDNAKLHVRHSKTQAGIRTIDLVPMAVRVLRDYKRTCPHTAPDDLVFPTNTGGKRDKDNLRSRVLEPVVEMANELLRERGQRLLPDGISPHKLRHTFASILAVRNVNPVSAKRQIGHRRYEFTLSAYTHDLASEPRERERLLTLIAN